MKISFTSATSITIEMDKKVVLSTNDVENLINQLSNFRKNMKPEIPRTITDGEKEGLVDPIWGILPIPVSEQMMLTVRHDGLGWLNFLLSKTEAQKLGNALLQSSQSQLPPIPQNQHRH